MIRTRILDVEKHVSRTSVGEIDLVRVHLKFPGGDARVAVMESYGEPLVAGKTVVMPNGVSWNPAVIVEDLMESLRGWSCTR
jgi:hypothetical protein